MAETPREIELKFAVPAGRAAETAAAIEALAGAEPRALTSTYYDTAKGALRQAKMALRVRRSGETYIQTLKDRGDGALSRGEWETPVKGPTPSLAALKATPAARIVAKATLVPVYLVEVKRRTADVVEGESRIELAFDEGVAKAKGNEAAFAELGAGTEGWAAVGSVRPGAGGWPAPGISPSPSPPRPLGARRWPGRPARSPTSSSRRRCRPTWTPAGPFRPWRGPACARSPLTPSGCATAPARR